MDDDDHSMSDAAPVPQPTWQWRPPPNWPPAPPGWLPPPGWMPPPNWPPPPAGWSFWQADTADHWEWPEPTGPVVLPEGKLRSSLVWETRFLMVAFLVPTVTAAVVLFAKHVSGVGTVTRFPVIVANPVTNLVLGILSYGSVAAVVAPDRLEDAALELAAAIASKSPTIIRRAKESLNGIDPVDVKRSYRYEQGFTYELHVRGVADEQRAAFVEKRDADTSK